MRITFKWISQKCNAVGGGGVGGMDWIDQAQALVNAEMNFWVP